MTPQAQHAIAKEDRKKSLADLMSKINSFKTAARSGSTPAGGPESGQMGQ
jgi:hypothetical protein